MTGRKARIERAFSAQADAYDAVALVQGQVAAGLAARIRARGGARPKRILEIGCGTGLLSAHLAGMFPEAALLLTDISPDMLGRARARLGRAHRYRVLDGEYPEALEGKFDLIASSLAVQWFGDLQGGLARLSRLLAPGGRLVFATLGARTFVEWRQVHAELGLACGTQNYPGAEEFPWPEGAAYAMAAEFLVQYHADGLAFVRRLKLLGAREPAPGHRPLSPGAFRRLLGALEGGFSVTYHVLYGEIFG